MNIKTLGDLRRLIAEEGGAIELGILRLEIGNRNDVDIRIKGLVCAWLSGPDETDLRDRSEGTVMLSMFAPNTFTGNVGPKTEDTQVVEAVSTFSQFHEGKVAAYEKILFTGEVTINLGKK